MGKLRHPVARVVALSEAMVALWGCAGGPRAASSAEIWPAFVGEWTNAEYSGLLSFPQRIVIKNDFSAEEYLYLADDKAKLAWKGTFRKAWTDSDGLRYCLLHFVYTPGADPIEGAALFGIDKLWRSFEGIWVNGVPASGKSSDWAFAQLETWNPEIAKKLNAAAWRLNCPYAIHRRK